MAAATDTLAEARAAFILATASRYWRTYDWYIDRILDEALEAGVIADA